MVFCSSQILDPRGEFYHEVTPIECPLRRREGPSTCTINMTSIFVDISKHDVVLFVYM